MKTVFTVAALMALTACSGPGTFKPMAVNPAVPPVVMTAMGCAMTGACVMP